MGPRSARGSSIPGGPRALLAVQQRRSVHLVVLGPLLPEGEPAGGGVGVARLEGVGRAPRRGRSGRRADWFGVGSRRRRRLAAVEGAGRGGRRTPGGGRGQRRD